MLARKELVEHATLAVLKSAAAGPPELEAWLAGAVRKEPLTIYDINGQPLFHDFAVARGKELFGHVRMAASQVLGKALVALELGPRLWDYDAAVKKLVPRLKREFARARVAPPKLVCYSYPKLGVMFEVTEGSGTTTQVIYDVSSLTRVPLQPQRADSEGFHAWSYYDALSDAERKKRLARFKKVDAERGGLSDKLRRDMVAARSLTAVAAKLELAYRRHVTKLLQFCTHYGHTHARSHHCFVLHGQQVNDYCAVATCQMILCYYRYYYTQDQIAPSLGYNAGGGCPPDQSPGYESLTCNHLAASFDSAPTWEKGRDQIDLLRPFKSGVPGHARAVAGYSYVRWLWGAGLEDKKLYVYDPWPWNADYAQGGTVTWEDWDSITHTNYVYAQVNCP